MLWQASCSSAKFYHSIFLFNSYNWEEYKKNSKKYAPLETAIEQCIEKNFGDHIHLVF